MQAAILAGGLGTRLRPLSEKIPKPMVSVNGKPFLEYEIELLKKNGVHHFVLCVGYLGDVIQDHFGDGRKFGVRIAYSAEGKKLLGPAGALKKAEPILEDSFIATYGDGYLLMDYQVAWDRFLRSSKLGMMAVYENHNELARSDLVVKGGYVTRYDKKNSTPEMVWINFGVSFLKRKALQFIPADKEYGEEEFYNMLIEKQELLAYETKERFYEIGTPAALREFESFMSSKK
ncbi:MAG: sugar phosphate nucleotidyltransferase [Nitrososphaerales archaeon]